MRREYARRAEDVIWRRTRLGLRLTEDQIAAIDRFMIASANAPAAVE
jgi:glycerol-3-phosphate dehydrogenase